MTFRQTITYSMKWYALPMFGGIVCLLLVNVADTDTVVGSMSLVFGILSPARLLSHALPCLLIWFDLMLL
jgi:hypothetical protein